MGSLCFFFSSRRRHTRCSRDWSSHVCSSDLTAVMPWSVACDPGQLNIVWYGTSFYDGTTAPDNYPASAAWYVFFAQNLNAAATGSTFTQGAATPIIHYSGVCGSGAGCTGNRDLYDQF